MNRLKHPGKACKACNTPVKPCNNYVKSRLKACFLQAFYRVSICYYTLYRVTDYGVDIILVCKIKYEK